MVDSVHGLLYSDLIFDSLFVKEVYEELSEILRLRIPQLLTNVAIVQVEALHDLLLNFFNELAEVFEILERDADSASSEIFAL